MIGRVAGMGNPPKYNEIIAKGKLVNSIVIIATALSSLAFQIKFPLA